MKVALKQKELNDEIRPAVEQIKVDIHANSDIKHMYEYRKE